jgi:hypothetical protein
MDILDPDLMKVNEFITTLQSKQRFQFGAMESRGNGLCRYISSEMYDLPNEPINSTDFLIEFISDCIPKKYFSPDYLTAAIKNQLKFVVPDDFKISFKSIPDITRRRYYIKDDLEFNVIPQFFMLHCHTNNPEYILTDAGIMGMGFFRNAGYGKFRILSPENSPLYLHGEYNPTPITFSEEEIQVLKAALLHDIIPKIGGIDLLRDFLEKEENLSMILLKLHYDWHEIRKHEELKVSEFLEMIEKSYNKKIASFYNIIAVADQLAASLTRTNTVRTFSRYVAGHVAEDRFDFLTFSRSLLELKDLYTLWKKMIYSKKLAKLNESFEYGDQPLSTHLLLTMGFTTYLIRKKTAYIIAKIRPRNGKKFEQHYWNKIYNIAYSKAPVYFTLEEKVPQYSKEEIKKVLVKSIKPDTGWLRTQ